MTLDEIALKHCTDKSSASHNYTPIYESLLEPLRDEPITLLELGWGGHDDPDAGGASARMWREYLPHARIVVVDIAAKNNVPDGIEFHQLSQADPNIAARLGDTFDVIIDDASHLSSLTIASFQLLWPALADGGLYIVEDTHGAYHDFYYGPHEANPNPDRGARGGRQTMMQFFKRLADEVNFRGDGDWDLFPARYALGYDIDWITFHFNMVVARKR